MNLSGEFFRVLFCRYNVLTLSCIMDKNLKRATIYFDGEIHKALKIKAAETNQSISELVSKAVTLTFREDLEDLADIQNRISEPNITFDAILSELKESGKI